VTLQVALALLIVPEASAGKRSRILEEKEALCPAELVREVVTDEVGPAGISARDAAGLLSGSFRGVAQVRGELSTEVDVVASWRALPVRVQLWRYDEGWIGRCPPKGLHLVVEFAMLYDASFDGRPIRHLSVDSLDVAIIGRCHKDLVRSMHRHLAATHELRVAPSLADAGRDYLGLAPEAEIKFHVGRHYMPPIGQVGLGTSRHTLDVGALGPSGIWMQWMVEEPACVPEAEAE